MCILPTWLCVNIDLSVACTKWFVIDRGGPHQQESIPLVPDVATIETQNVDDVGREKRLPKLRRLLGDHLVQHDQKNNPREGDLL